MYKQPFLILSVRGSTFCRPKSVSALKGLNNTIWEKSFSSIEAGNCSWMHESFRISSSSVSHFIVDNGTAFKSNNWDFLFFPAVTDRATERQTTLVRALNARADVLQEQNNELQDLNEQLQAEILSLRRLTSYKEDGEKCNVFKY